MNLESGDILRKGSKFYRVYDFAKKSRDVVCNQILYNPKREELVLAHDFVYIAFNDIGKGYDIVNDDIKQRLEILKRKYKLDKINKIDGISE